MSRGLREAKDRVAWDDIPDGDETTACMDERVLVEGSGYNDHSIADYRLRLAAPRKSRPLSADMRNLPSDIDPSIRGLVESLNAFRGIHTL